MSSPLVSILIASTNQAAHLAECLTALRRDGCATPREIVLVLNGATPEVRSVAAAFPEARVLESPVNLGVPGGYNRGRAAARGDLLALIHDDTIVGPGWLDHLVSTLDSHPEAGATGGLVFHPGGGLQNAGSIVWADGWARWQWWGEEAPDPASFAGVDVVHTVGSSFALVRAEALDAAGGLDESLYPGYFVDVTLGMCLRETGRIVLLDPRARAEHHRGASSSREYRMFLSHRNHARFCARWRAVLDRDHEPFSYSPEAYAAAHARARAVAERLRRERRWESAARPERIRLDPAEQERRALEAEEVLRREWSEEIARRQDA